jgi:hypothetical protein
VWVAAKKRGSTPVKLREAPTGKQVVKLRPPSYMMFSFSVDVKQASFQTFDTKLEKRKRTEQKILNEFKTAADSLWIKNNKYGTGYLRITAGSSRLERKSKGMFVQSNSSLLSVPDTKVEVIYSEHAELQSRGLYSRRALEGGSLIWVNNFLPAGEQRGVYSRVDASDR